MLHNNAITSWSQKIIFLRKLKTIAIRIKGIKIDMDMMKRKQLTSKDGGDVKATKTDDQEQAWCKKDKRLYKKGWTH